MVPDGCFENAFIDGAGADNLNGRAYVTFGGVPPDDAHGQGRRVRRELQEEVQRRARGVRRLRLRGGQGGARRHRDAPARRTATPIRAAIVSIKDFDGALGNWSFDENGDTTLTTMSGNTVKDGKFEFVKVLGQGQ